VGCSVGSRDFLRDIGFPVSQRLGGIWVKEGQHSNIALRGSWEVNMCTE
jgi:hypothetical protein